MSTPPTREAEIRTALDARDREAAATLTLRAFGPEIRRLLLRVAPTPADADDAFGIFSEMLWRGVDGFRGESSVRTWSYRLAWHALARIRRDPFHRRGRRLDTPGLDALVAEVRDSTAAFQASVVKDRMRAIRQQLDPMEQLLLSLRVDSGLSWRETAEVVAAEGEPIEEAALRKRFERAKARLKKLAEQAGIAPSRKGGSAP